MNASHVFFVEIMFRFYPVFLLISYFTFTISIDTNKSLSNVVYDSNQNHHEDIFNQKTDRLDGNNDTNNKQIVSPKIFHQQLLNERLKVIITIGCIAVGTMVVIVITFIAVTYFKNKRRNVSIPSEQTTPLNTPKPRRKKTVSAKKPSSI
jgi:hypothetical protein